MKKLILYLTFGIITSCNNVEEPPVINSDRDYLLINSTVNDQLSVYYERNSNDCENLQLLKVLNQKESVPFHVSPGETVYIIYCTQTDVFCSGCRMKKIIGNSETGTTKVYLN